MLPTESIFDHVVVGAGLDGLRRACVLSRQPGTSVCAVDSAPAPGGKVQTRRTEGYVCELGPFAFGRDQIRELAEPLAHPPPAIPALPNCREGHAWDGSTLRPSPLAEPPFSFRGGAEDLVTAYRRELGSRLLLGRAVTAVAPIRDGWQLTLGGEVPTTLTARSLTLAIPVAAAAALLAALDPRIQEVGTRLRHEPGAFVFLGFTQGEVAQTLTGYGILPDPGLTSPIAEAIFCTNVFARRALPGHALARIEVAGPATAADDATIVPSIEQELRRWTGLDARVRFQRVHRFRTEAPDGAWAEARARLRALGAIAPGLDVRC